MPGSAPASLHNELGSLAYALRGHFKTGRALMLGPMTTLVMEWFLAQTTDRQVEILEEAKELAARRKEAHPDEGDEPRPNQPPSVENPLTVVRSNPKRKTSALADRAGDRA